MRVAAPKSVQRSSATRRERDRLRAERDAARAEAAEWKAKYEELAAKFALMEQRLAELDARLKENSASSDRPPSSDPPWNKPPARPRTPSGRKRGGQPGHKGTTRALLPTDQVDAVKPYFPSNCGGCGVALPARASAGPPPPRRHQVTEVVPAKPTVTEHQAHGALCACGHVTYAEFPAEVRCSAFGPRLQASIALLTGRFRLSRREVVEAAESLFGVDISLGSITAVEQATSEALKAPYEEALKAVREAGVTHADETGWRNGSTRAWLWIAVTSALAVFWVDPRRNRAAFTRFLGAFAGYLVSDRWGAYMKHPKRRHQLCWAHLLRDFEKLILRGGDAKKLAVAAIAQIKTIFELWHRFRRGEIARATLRREIKPIQDRLYDLLVEGTQNSHKKASGLCAKLIPLWPCLWVFLRVPGVEPTNNDGERDLRKAVLWRKGSFGSQSDSGCLYVSRVLTAVASLRKQRRDIVDFLERAIRAHRTGSTPPSLLPTGEHAQT